jgi:hypothetical protein
LRERRESHGKIIGKRQLPHGIANGQKPVGKNRKARATTLGGTGGDWKTLSSGRTAAGVMAGVNGRQTNKYSTATGKDDSHDDFTGNEIHGRAVSYANSQQSSTDIRLNRHCWHWWTNDATKPTAAAGADMASSAPTDESPSGCEVATTSCHAMLED